MTDPPEFEILMVYKCHRCGWSSYHPMDVSERYCVRCHTFEDDPEPEDDAP